MRVRIKKAPGRDDTWQMTDDGGGMKGGEWGDNSQFSKGSGFYREGGAVEMNRSLGPVNRMDANIEAERGETAMGDFDDDGMQEHLAIGGQPHSKGGTPLSVPNGSFIFSKTRSLKMGGPVLAEFGKSATTKKKYTPAELAKQYDLNRYKNLLQDEDSDIYTRKTAALMAQNYQQKLSKLALYQEAMKGFPQGIPALARPALERVVGGQLSVGGREDDRGQMTDDSGRMTDDGGGMMARRGGLVKAAWGYSGPPVDPYKGDRGNPRKDQQKLGLKKGFNEFYAPWLTDFGYDTDEAGMNAALQSKGYTGDLRDTKGIQNFLIQQNLDKGNYGLFKDLLTNYRMTNQGVRAGLPTGADALPADLSNYKNDPAVRAKLEKAFADGLFGVRSGDMFRALFPDYKMAVPSVKRIPNDPGRINIPGGPRAYQFPQPTADPEPPAPKGEYNAQTPPSPGSPKWRGAAKDRMPWWSQDKINFGASLLNRYDLKKYMPTYVGANAVLPSATFYDPTRQLAANQEAAAQQNMMAAMYAGPQRMRAVGSNIQGQGASNAANILAQVQNQNVGVANQFEGMRSEILNNQALRNAAARKTYLDESTMANQQYDNAVRMMNNDVRTNLLSGMSNAQKTHWLNRMNPYFNINPTTGRLAFNNKGKGILSDSTGAGVSNPITAYNTALQQFNQMYPGQANSERAYSFAEKVGLGSKSRYGVDSDGDASMSMSGFAPNAQALALMNMYGGR